MPFLDSLDIANAALQLCGVDQIATPTEDSKANKETAFAYDKLRQPELRLNVWRFSIRKAVLRAVDETTMILVPTAYASTTTYLPGSVVSDSNGQVWTSMEPDNINNAPGDTDVWDMYFGPMSVTLWDEDTTYFSGELVYKLGAIAGSYSVYKSLQNDNDDEPDTATAWDATVTYTRNQTVSNGGFQWRSLIEANLNVTPAVVPLAFDIAATYAASDTVTASDNFIYSSVAGSNVGNDPTTDGGVHWTNTNVAAGWAKTPILAVSSIKWLVLNATIKSLLFAYPIGTGPSSQNTTLNVFRLPAGFLKVAQQDPKAGSTAALGAPSGRIYEDWNLEGNYLISSNTDPILLRFAADITKVQDMDPLFCKGLSCAIAAQICAPLTQSGTKLQTIASEYKLFMGQARQTNAIELGPDEPAQDSYITARY